jgi:hypothetical protein
VLLIVGRLLRLLLLLLLLLRRILKSATSRSTSASGTSGSVEIVLVWKRGSGSQVDESFGRIGLVFAKNLKNCVDFN